MKLLYPYKVRKFFSLVNLLQIITLSSLKVDYAIYSPLDEIPCTTIEPTVIPNPIPIDSGFGCNSWEHPPTWNSMKILSCSQNCICFHQWASSDSCDGPSNNVKIACVDQCLRDAQGTFIHLTDFEGCIGDDSEYGTWECNATGMMSDQVITIIDIDGSILTVNGTVTDTRNYVLSDYSYDENDSDSIIPADTKPEPHVDLVNWGPLSLLLLTGIFFIMFIVRYFIHKDINTNTVHFLKNQERPLIHVELEALDSSSS